jgi:preprotein translocase subunit SecY
MNTKLVHIADWIEANLNIYNSNPSAWAVLLYFVLIVVFTFFYTLIVFSPDRMSDNIQKRWGFVPWIRPWKETSTYINKILMHLCLWWWMWLALVWVYSYVLNYIPFIQDLVQSLWSLPVIVTWSGVIIIVWVVQEIINKIETELIMQKYEKYDTDEVNKSLREL